jgi:hypothetical protein
VAELRAERTGDFEQVAGAHLHLVAEGLGGAVEVQALPKEVIESLVT